MLMDSPYRLQHRQFWLSEVAGCHLTGFLLYIGQGGKQTIQDITNPIAWLYIAYEKAWVTKATTIPIKVQISDIIW